MKKSLLISRLGVLGAALVFMLSAGVSSASALTFDLTSDHCTGGCLTGQTSGGTITVTEGVNSLIFDVVLLNGNTFVSTGFDATFGFNLNGNPSVTYSGLTAGWLIDPCSNANPPVCATNPVSASTLHMDGTGDFEYGVQWSQNGGGNGTAGPLHFVITAAGLSLASLEDNALDQFFAVDILSGTTGKTGAIDASHTVPDGGSTVMLLGSALFGLGVLRRRFRKS